VQPRTFSAQNAWGGSIRSGVNTGMNEDPMIRWRFISVLIMFVLCFALVLAFAYAVSSCQVSLRN